MNIEGIITETATRYGIDPESFKRFAWVESKLDPKAVSPTGAKGLFQFTSGTAKQYGLAKPFDPKANADAAARLYLDNQKTLTKTLGRAPNEAELYLAHQQGAGGAAALLARPGANVVDALAPAYKGDRKAAARAIKVNGGSLDMTAGQFAARWTNKFGGHRVLDESPNRSDAMKEYIERRRNTREDMPPSRIPAHEVDPPRYPGWGEIARAPGLGKPASTSKAPGLGLEDAPVRAPDIDPLAEIVARMNAADPGRFVAMTAEEYSRWQQQNRA